MGRGEEITIPVQSKDPKQDKTKEEITGIVNTSTDDDLPEEDKKLKADLELSVQRLVESNEDGVALLALNMLRNEIRAATSSMTSVPKPLKYLRPFYDDLKKSYKKYSYGSQIQKEFADILSVLAMTMAEKNSFECLKFKFEGNRKDLGVWGHEYIRHLTGEVGREYNYKIASQNAMDDEKAKAGHTKATLSELIEIVVLEIVPFHMKHNAEPEAIDILIEIQHVHLLGHLKDNSADDMSDRDELNIANLTSMIDENNYQRICLYLLGYADYMTDHDELQTLYRTVFSIYKHMKQYVDALRIALRAKYSKDDIQMLFNECKDISIKKQLAFVLASCHSSFQFASEEEAHMSDETESGHGSLIERLDEIISNVHLHEYFHILAKDLDVLEGKTPEDIYKSHLSETASSLTARSRNNELLVDSAKENLSSTFVSAFVNAAYGFDKLILPKEASKDEKNSNEAKTNTTDEWIYKNKSMGMLNATAGIGLLMLWNIDEGITQLDKYLYSDDVHIKAGAILGTGILSTGVMNDCDPALALLTEQLDHSSPLVKSMALLSLGIAYVGKARSDLMEVILPFLSEEASGGSENRVERLQVPLFAAVALSLIYIGTCEDEISSVILQRLMETSDIELNHTTMRLYAVSLGLLYLNAEDKVEAILEALETISHPIQKYFKVTLETCAYAGTGNVLKIQEMLHICSEHLSKPSENSDANPADEENATATDSHKSVDVSTDYHSVAVLGLSLIALTEPVSKEMILRTFNHLLQYGDLQVRQAIPLSIALLNISNPEYGLVDILSRLTHDSESKVVQTAILSLGLVAAGTNNSRVAGMLRQLSEFYSKDSETLLVVRLSQGLLHLGKGLLTLHPLFSDGFLLNNNALAGILLLSHISLDLKYFLESMPYLFYAISMSISPRMLLTMNEDLEVLPCNVRVGQALNVVGQAGKPKRITGFQTHTTPVLLNVKERAELATEEYIPCTSVLENIVILKKNPEYKEE